MLPVGSERSSATRPPCSSAIREAIESPSPAPPPPAARELFFSSARGGLKIPRERQPVSARGAAEARRHERHQFRPRPRAPRLAARLQSVARLQPVTRHARRGGDRP